MGVEGPPSCCASNKDRDVNQLGLAVFVFLNSFLHLLSFRQACFCAVSYVLWPHTSCFLMNAFSWCSHFKQHLVVVCGLCFPHWSIHTAHAWRTCANSSFVGVVLLGSNKHIVFVLNSSWTLMNYDNHLTVNNMCSQERNKETVFEMKKTAALVLSQWLYHTSCWFTYHDWHIFTSVDLLFLWWRNFNWTFFLCLHEKH